MSKPLTVSHIPVHRRTVGDKPVALCLKGTDPRAIIDGARAFLKSQTGFDLSIGRRIVDERFTHERIADRLESENSISSFDAK